jgi:hypothetical protein
VRLAWLPLLAACQGSTGTIDLALTTAPGSTVLDGVQHLRVTLSEPFTVLEADRGASGGFDIALDVEATGGPATLTVEGLDAGGSLIAVGASPAFAVSAIDARIVIYMAAPLSIEPAPARLPAARIGVASTPLSYGFTIAGGEDAAGTRTDAIFIYNVFDHTLLAGLPMPEPRSFQTILTGSTNAVYLFGGLGTDGAPTGSAWRFDTNAKPNGAYAIGDDHVELARSGASGIVLSPDNNLITGTPALDFDLGTPTARTDISALPTHGVAVIAGPLASAVFTGDPMPRIVGDTFDTIALAADDDATAAALVDGRVVFASARGTTGVLVVDVAAGTGSLIDAQSVARHDAAVAATARHLVIAGGTDDAGTPLATADILDLELQRITTVPCFARSGASAHALPNGQIAIVGGAPANDVIELFTPPP